MTTTTWLQRPRRQGIFARGTATAGIGIAILITAFWGLLGAGCAPYDIDAAARAAWTATAAARPPATETPVPTATPVPPTATPRPSPQPTAAPTQKPAAAAGPSKLEDIASKTAAVRGLPLKAKVPVGNLTRDQLQEFLVKAYEKDNAQEDLEQSKAALVMLELLKESDDLRELALGLLTEQVVGFYDFEAREMKMVEMSRDITPLEELSLAHEYVHAAQDQNFRLGESLKKAKGDGELALGLRTLSEGDATLAMGLYARQHMTPEQMQALGNQPPSSPGSSKLAAAPPVLQVQLLFPYQQGAIFAGTLIQRGGFTMLNQAYGNPPTTSEHLLHPDKYLAREGARAVELPDLTATFGQGWSLWDTDTLGEMGLLSYLSNGLPANTATKAAAGWGGDRSLLFRGPDGKQALVCAITWDSPQEATEFYSALRELRNSRKDSKVTIADDQRLAWSGAGRAGHARIKGSQVFLVIAPDEATAKRVADRLAGS